MCGQETRLLITVLCSVALQNIKKDAYMYICRAQGLMLTTESGKDVSCIEQYIDKFIK